MGVGDKISKISIVANMKSFFNSLSLATLVILLIGSPSESQVDPAAGLPEYKVLSVHDGDTIRAQPRSGKAISVRLACIDAPELKQPLGLESRDYLKKILDEAKGTVRLNITTTDRYGRSVAEVWTRGGLIQSRMVAEGLAFSYDKYKKDCPHWDAVISSEKYAIDRKLGVWSDSSFVKPWDYKKKK